MLGNDLSFLIWEITLQIFYIIAYKNLFVNRFMETNYGNSQKNSFLTYFFLVSNNIDTLLDFLSK